MQMLLILAASLSILSCRSLPSNPPKPPEVSYQWAVILDKNQTPFCVRYTIVSQEPLRVDRNSAKAFAISRCQGMTGLQLRDYQAVISWIDDLQAWARSIQQVEVTQ